MSETGDWPYQPDSLYVKLSDGTTNGIVNLGNLGEKWHPGVAGVHLIGPVKGDYSFSPPRRMAVDFGFSTCEEYNNSL